MKTLSSFSLDGSQENGNKTTYYTNKLSDAPMWPATRWLHCSHTSSFNRKSPFFLSFLTFSAKFMSQVLQRGKHTSAEHSSVCCCSRRRFLQPWKGIGALRPLAGAGLAALLTVELVAADAVLRDQVTPAEMVHAVFFCRENQPRDSFSRRSD